MKMLHFTNELLFIGETWVSCGIDVFPFIKLWTLRISRKALDLVMRVHNCVTILDYVNSIFKILFCQALGLSTELLMWIWSFARTSCISFLIVRILVDCKLNKYWSVSFGNELSLRVMRKCIFMKKWAFVRLILKLKHSFKINDMYLLRSLFKKEPYFIL